MNLVHAERAFSQANLPEFCKQLELLFPKTEAGRVQELVHYAMNTASVPDAADGPESIFLSSISLTKKILSGAQLPGLRHLRIGPELDFLCDIDGITGWTFSQLLNYLLLGRIRPTRGSVVVTAIRDDGIYILEWVSHYLALGFDHIIIYTNDNADGSEVLLRLLAEHGVITLIENETTGTVSPESKGFGHAIHLLHDFRDFEWALFVDSDEYFIPGTEYGGSISSLLSAIQTRFPDKPISGICYDWLWFVSGMIYRRTSDLLLERFQHAKPHHLTKCMVRIQDIVSMRRDHYPEVKTNGLVVDSAFEPIDLSSIYNKIPQYSGGRVNHYWARSFEEFAVKKARGATLQLDENLYDRPFEKFFAWNGFETPDNHYPPDLNLLSKIKVQIEDLKNLEGVREAADLIDKNFTTFVGRIAEESELRKIYEAAKADPAAL